MLKRDTRRKRDIHSAKYLDETITRFVGNTVNFLITIFMFIMWPLWTIPYKFWRRKRRAKK